jgi:DNA-binding LacI/PurR family transcriptional regulator
VPRIAAEHKAAQPRPTIYDVAKRARVSTATVSKVLRGVTTVGLDNSARVEAAVRELSYRSDPLAANLRRNTRNIVGLIVPDFRNPFFGALVASIESQAEASGYRLVTVSSGEDDKAERRQIEALLDWRVAGILLVPHSTATFAAKRLKQKGVPLVLLDRVSRSRDFDGVGVDNARSAHAMVQRFRELGHRKLLVAISSPTVPNMAARLAGVREAAKGGMEIEILECGTHGQDDASRAMAKRFARGATPQAIFALFNPATLAALKEIAKRGLRVPEDVSLAGFDDFEWMQVMHPPVAAVVQPVEYLAGAAWTRLMDRIADPHGEKSRIELPCIVEFRESLAKANGAPADHHAANGRSARTVDKQNGSANRAKPNDRLHSGGPL